MQKGYNSERHLVGTEVAEAVRVGAGIYVLRK
ncbi:MAG: hypothetical protein JWM16_2322 [Verrucomicrobiales bacterium]|nr:hypothetical protein [Verrucomicrobiales bacterium]